ncbi:MAG: insulinase family protein [Ruminococcaceae bacterium]|nr:insulinase family protein [Oscillospiraceae bacterium]
MIPKKYPIGARMSLSACGTDRFKAGMLSISAVMPIERERVWLTPLLLSVLRRGTRQYPSLAELNRRLDYLYGTELAIRNFYRGDCQIIGFSVEMLGAGCLPAGEDLIGEILDVVREILFFPLLDENGWLDARYVESEKRHQCDSIRALKNNPRAYAAERCRAILYQNEPCGADPLGNEADVMAVTPEALTRYWRQLTETLSLDCFYVGGDPAEHIADALGNTFGELLGEHAVSRCNTVPHLLAPTESVVRVDESLPFGQSHLLMGLTTGVSVCDPRYAVCAVWNEMLGVSPVSRLFVNVREKLSLCYFCSSQYNAYKGAVVIHCGIDRANRALAEEEILTQLRALAEGDFSETELHSAKKSLVNAYRQLEDSPAAIENFYYGRSLVGMSVSVRDFTKQFTEVTREQVIEFARGVHVNAIYFLGGTLDSEDMEEQEAADDDD